MGFFLIMKYLPYKPCLEERTCVYIERDVCVFFLEILKPIRIYFKNYSNFVWFDENGCER